MNIDENWLNYADKKYPKTKATKQLDSHINKIQDVKAQLNAGKYRQRRQGVSLAQFLRAELTRGYQLENDEESFSARREKLYSFLKIPKEVEKFMAYGFLQCADSFLFVYTFLPLRFMMALWTVVTRPLWHCLGKKRDLRVGERCLRPAEMCDLLKGIVVVTCWAATWKVDTSMMYHLVKSQSVIKLYIFYNMLEVGDRLCSVFGQDIIDALFWTATEPKSKSQARSQQLGILPHLLFAFTYVLLHSILVLFQATTLNVAINSSNKALLTIMMSNNFVELKGSVFKKFDKNNLFQLSCADVRERFHLMMLLLAVNLQTMKEYAWKAERLAVLLPDCILLLFAEILVDWVKHAFITRFNELNSTVYRDYTIKVAYDMAQTRQETAFSDPSDVVARRMGFIPLPLGVAIGRVLCTTITPPVQPANIILLLLAYFILVTFKILNSLIILGKACDVILSHSKKSDHEVTYNCME
ncbi:hypothetical protein QLX08_004988 [Tetragonisca angustula]|uniref:Protein TAPT1 homolog n=1 Tax=Tetragonisca angustula TaxID=166442 RepID=A0AAW1A1N8_9HYME